MNYYKKLIIFFKSHGINDENMFNYIHKQTEFMDSSNNELKDLRGIYYKYDKNKKLTGFHLYIPSLINEETVLLSIRPYIQAVFAYNNLEKRYTPNYECEMMAIHFEKTYLKENPNPKLETYLNKIYTSIKNQTEESKYKTALKVQEILEKELEEKNNIFDYIQQEGKKLVKKKESK